MTVPVQTPINSYTADGINNTYAFTFRILANTDLFVTVDGAPQTEGVEYTVQNVSPAGGDVVFEAANIPILGADVRLVRATSKDQTTDYVAGDPFPAETHELGLDKLTMLLQEAQSVATGGFDPNANYSTTGNWTNAGNWAFVGNLTYNGLQVATVNQIPDIANFTQRAVAEPITAGWDFQNGITLNQSSWPLDQGNANQVLKTDGLGALAWIDQSGGAGFDPTANYTTSGVWTNNNVWSFNGSVSFTNTIIIDNNVAVTGRNFIDSASVDIVKVDTNDFIRLGSSTGFIAGAIHDLPPSTSHSFRVGGAESVQIAEIAQGSLLLQSLNGAERKAGYRNPGTVRDISASDVLIQADEGQSIMCSGAGGFNIDVPVLEEGTKITVKNFSVGAITLTDIGVTQTAYLGGSRLVGALTIAPDSIVQLDWRSTILVDVWGSGIT